MTRLCDGGLSCRATGLTLFIVLELRTFHLTRYAEPSVLPFHLLRA